MRKLLAIIAPQVGAISETFIRRHMEDLLPDQTVVITNTIDGPYAGHWQVKCPTLVLNQVPWGGFNQGLFTFLARKASFISEKDCVFKVIKQFLQKYKVEVILGEYLDSSLGYLELAQQLGIRFFAHEHGGDFSMWRNQTEWQNKFLQYNQATGIITSNSINKARLIELGLEANKVHFIPYGIDVSNTPPAVKLDQDTIRCLAVGRMVSKKAPILLLDAFRRAVEVQPNLRLDYVGTGSLLPAVQQFISAFQLYNQVTLHGGQPSEVVHSLMDQTDIFLQHSIIDPGSGDEEGMPIAILEAMSRGLPVVSTRHAGIPEAVLEDKTGFLVNEGNTVEMANFIIFLSKNPHLRHQMGIAGWKRVQELFTWQREKENLLKLLSLSSKH